MSKKIVAIDLDGTILNYGNHVGEIRVNDVFIAKLAADGVKKLFVVTNQGGLVWSKTSIKHPTPLHFVTRCYAAIKALRNAGIEVIEVRAALFHPKANKTDIAETRDELLHSWNLSVPLTAHTSADYRKPRPDMLKPISVTDYYGDSPEDEQAALAAGATFHPVVRFE